MDGRFLVVAVSWRLREPGRSLRRSRGRSRRSAATASTSSTTPPPITGWRPTRSSMPCRRCDAGEVRMLRGRTLAQQDEVAPFRKADRRAGDRPEEPAGRSRRSAATASTSSTTPPPITGWRPTRSSMTWTGGSSWLRSRGACENRAARSAAREAYPLADGMTSSEPAGRSRRSAATASTSSTTPPPITGWRPTRSSTPRPHARTAGRGRAIPESRSPGW
jgi:hypothetical protein